MYLTVFAFQHLQRHFDNIIRVEKKETHSCESQHGDLSIASRIDEGSFCIMYLYLPLKTAVLQFIGNVIHKQRAFPVFQAGPALHGFSASFKEQVSHNAPEDPWLKASADGLTAKKSYKECNRRYIHYSD